MTKNQLLIFGAIALVAVGLIFAFIFGRKEPPAAQIEGDILVWGVFDDSDVMSGLINKFNQSYPRIKITYQKKSVDTYEGDLINALAAGKGPDIFYFHNTWLPKHIDKLEPASDADMTISDFRDNFVDVASQDFISDDKIYALPLYADTLALFYNKDIFNTVGIANPPSTWEGLVSLVPSLTQKDESGNITRSAIAIGTAKNVNRSTDILSLLMLQSGTQMTESQSGRASFNRETFSGSVKYPSGQQALEFYTNFASPKKQVYTWNNQIGYSIDSFLEGKTAMMINYSYQIQNILAKAPHLRFGISLMLQPKGVQQNVNYANYWGLAVSKTAKAPDIAWGFASYLTQKDQAQIYLTTTSKPTARRDLVDYQRQESKELAIFAQQALSAYSWKQPDSVAVEKILGDMIESTVSGVPAKNALDQAVNNFDLLLNR